MAVRTANPALNANTFSGLGVATDAAMTVQGTVNRTGILLLLLIVSAAWTWDRFLSAGRSLDAIGGLIVVGALGGLLVALITVFKRSWAPVTAPVYAVLEGLFLGGISSIFEARFPGIVLQAVALTFGTLGGLLLAYKSGLIPVTANFRLGIVAATGGICLVYVVSFVLGLFGIAFPYIHGSGPVGILFSLFVVIVAALNLVLDFDFIERGAESGAPKYMEWYAAFGLIVTLVWLYLEILRLLSKLRSRR